MQNSYGISGQYLSSIESGKYSLSIKNLISFSEKTGVSIDYILLGKKDNVSDKIINMLSKYTEDEMFLIFEIVQNIDILLNSYKKEK